MWKIKWKKEKGIKNLYCFMSLFYFLFWSKVKHSFDKSGKMDTKEVKKNDS